MKTMSCTAVFALTLSIVSASHAADEPRYFSIKLDDKLIGYAVASIEQVNRDGKQLVELKNKTSLKMALLGQVRNVLLDSTTLLEAQSLRPISYRLINTTNEVVTQVDSDFEKSVVRTWSYRKGDARGEPVETTLPAKAMILGNNNFAHWRLMLDKAASNAVDGKSTISVFVPESQQTDRFELVRGGAAENSVAGAKRKVVEWRLEKAQMDLTTDAATGEFLGMHLPQQRTTVEMADKHVVKVAEKARAEELLANQFIQSSVTFDDFLKVSRLEAAIDAQVIGSGVANEVAVLTTGMQSFEGEKTGDKIIGRVTVSSVQYDGQDSPAFPSEEQDFQQWLEPSVCIESDHEPIKVKSAELTRGAKNRWEAVLRVGRWVNKEIAYTIADTPSARLALEKKKGDCGPHSTLTVALLRAASIPSRLVGGVVYTPSFGGSFGQHAWVEVHMGPAGWVAIDPTTGEFESMSATHIKLFEGMGGVKPKTIEIAAYEPPNRVHVSAPPAEAKPMAWQFDKKYTFQYRKGDKDIGQETFTLAKKKQDGGDVVELTGDVKLKINMLSSLSCNTSLVVAPNAMPRSIRRDFAVLLKKTKIECAFEKGVVQVDISGSQTMSREIKVPDDAYCFDNNFMGCWVLICSQLKLEAGKPLPIRTFHPSSLQIISLTITPKAPAPITIGGQQVECFACEVAPIKNTFWITKDGRFVRASQGDLVIELTKLD